jgi:hypothetical protein
MGLQVTFNLVDAYLISARAEQAGRRSARSASAISWPRSARS